MEKKKLVFNMTKKKRLIFLTNDDGYKSVGINVLTKINKLIFENIWVFAPKFNQSAKSQSITINKNISIKKITNKEYVINGTPVDCVILGLNEFGDINKNSILLMSGIIAYSLYKKYRMANLNV